MSDKKIFSSLKINNIYLKNVSYENFNTERMETLNVTNNIEIESFDNNNIGFLVKQSIIVNKGKKSNINVVVGVDIQIDINNEIKEDEIKKELIKIAEKIIQVNAIDTKISLIIANLTNSFGERPIILPDESFKVENE